MNNLIIEGDKLKPNLFFEASTGILKISGLSIPENATLIYEPVLEWIEEYIKSPAEKTIFSIKMKYYNTASSKMFLLIMKLLDELYKSGANVKVEWLYFEEDEDMLDAGEYFSDFVEVPFEFLSYQ